MEIFIVRILGLGAMKITDKRYFISAINQTPGQGTSRISPGETMKMHEASGWENKSGRKSRRHLEKHPRIIANRIARGRSHDIKQIPLLFPRGQNADFRTGISW